MAKPSKQNRLKARLPRGFADRGPAEIAATRRMTETIRQVYERYGFGPVETPAIEFTDALGKFLPDQDRPNEGVFSFQDDDEQWMSLRYDLTAPLARYVAENFDALPKPYRSYRAGYVFRNEKPGPGRFRQFMQFDADTVGSASPAADAEMCMMAADALEALGVPRGSYVIKVNNRKCLDSIIESVGLAGEANAGRRLTVLRAIDKLDRLGWEGVDALLGEGRRDESGDFTKGAGLTAQQINEISLFLNLGSVVGFAKAPPPVDGSDRPIDDFLSHDVSGDSGSDGPDIRVLDSLKTLEAWADVFDGNTLGTEGVAELREIVRITEAAGYGSQRIQVASNLVRGLEYYTGAVYEAELTFEIADEKGRPVRFGSVGGGGRYDGLIGRFRGEAVPATGFSIGVSRLQAALTALGKLDTKPEPGPVVVTIFDRDRVADYQRMVQELRNANIRAELYLGNPKNFPNQLKYADRRNSPCVVIQGGDELARGEVTIKDLAAGSALAGASSERDDYLKKQAGAQVSVPRAALVETVRGLLARPGR